MVRIATFNAENLFARFRFKGVKKKGPDGKYIKGPDGKAKYFPLTGKALEKVAADGWAVDRTLFLDFDETSRRLTAQAIRETRADIIGLQEIEAMDTLKRFVRNKKYLGGEGYKYLALIDGNDPRFIDVALLSKHPFLNLRTHQFARTKDGKAYVFSRDCLEVEVALPGGRTITVFVNHFKSMIGGREETMPRREAQAKEVVRILKERFGGDPGKGDWAVLGDLNDYMPSTAIRELAKQPWMVNVVERIADLGERWTHYFSKEKHYSQLDYILLSRSLADRNPGAVPRIVRGGMPRRADRYPGARFPGVGENEPKASDHCPVVVEIDV